MSTLQILNGIKLGKYCYTDGTIQHEIMHKLGFHHEQVRPDRDNHVKTPFLDALVIF